MTLLWSPESIHDLIALRAHIAEHDPAAAKRVALASQPEFIAFLRARWNFYVIALLALDAALSRHAELMVISQ